MEQLAEEHGDLIVIGNSNIKAECFLLESHCRSSECAHHVDTGFGQDGVWTGSVCYAGVKPRLLWWSRVWSVHSELLFLSLLVEKRPLLPHTRMDAKIIKVQVKSRSCKVSDFWMFLG